MLRVLSDLHLRPSQTLKAPRVAESAKHMLRGKACSTLPDTMLLKLGDPN
jgi:hypothetical protein